MRADRLLSLLWLLQSGRPLTAAALARQLEVSPRTILRDVEALSAAGVPVYCDRGRTGGVRLLPGYRTDVAGLTEAEAQALLSVVAAPAASPLGLAGPLASALRKVTAALPAAVQPGVTLANRIHIDPGGWHHQPVPPHFDDLISAVAAPQRVQLRYQHRGSDRPARRTVDPAGLVNAAGAWYLAAFHRGRLRFYNGGRITRIELLNEPAHVPEGFDLAAAWAASKDIWLGTHEPVPARLRVRAGAMAHLHPSVRPATWDKAAVAESWLDVQITFRDLSHARTVFWALAPDIEVIEPAHLRDAIAHCAAAVHARHAAPAPPRESTVV
ncbi:MAG: WYL domain-containing protein [Bifidobacteriaceae bacterium]|nr:WYL domain-containing protein [Bifidobacteriaceae bacterium]